MDLLMWQLADSGFPAGGFAHSGGLEAALHHGEITGWDELERFTRAVVRQAGHSALPLVTAAHKAPHDLVELDALCEAFLSNPVANRASRAQGRGFLAACMRSFPRPELHRLHEIVRQSEVHGHHAPIFGAALKALEIPRVLTHRLFLFLTTRAVTTAAVRLGLVGTYEAQRLQIAIAPEIDRTIDHCSRLGRFDIANTAPLVDLFQSAHDRLYSRLFQS